MIQVSAARWPGTWPNRRTTLNDVLHAVGDPLALVTTNAPGVVTIASEATTRPAVRDALDYARPVGVWFRYFPSVQAQLADLGARIDAFERRRSDR